MSVHLYKNTDNEYHQHNNYHTYRAAGHVRRAAGHVRRAAEHVRLRKNATEKSISVRNIFFIDFIDIKI